MAGQAEASYSTSTSTSTSTAGSSPYDVFLNFRGEDTRKNFTGHLYRALKREGVNVFMDSYKLWEGEELGTTLVKAIQRSKVSIPVFSKGYANSNWCLTELAQMLYCRRHYGQIILPIFFDVDPSDVRHQTGCFKKVFLKHQRNFAPHVVDSWKEALREVGNLKGWVLKEVENGDESKLVELLVERVLKETCIHNVFSMSDVNYCIGLDSHLKNLLYLLNIGSKDVQFIGICGIGGIGKTTIAKALYNCIIESFDQKCFLEDIREEVLRHGLVYLQEKLIYSMSKRKVQGEILSVDRGKEWIKERLQIENVLLILDDVDHPSQLNALAIDLNWIGQGSRVIITTRDENILNMAKIDEGKIYRPKELGEGQSLQLFSLRAFRNVKPPEEYMELSRAIASYSGGLPLTLEVLGSYLSYVRSKEMWESIIQQLRENAPREVYESLKISYDNLGDYEKAIFLDAACFFIGWEKKTVISIWEACGFYPKSAIHRLINRNLIKFESNEDGGCYLRMQDQLRDMGREIVSKESFREPGKRSRLWSHDNVLEILEGNKGTDRVEGIDIPSDLLIPLTGENFERMSNLRFLNINPKSFMVDFSCLPSALKWFRWNTCTLDILPTNFYHKRLVHLDLSFSTIKQAWNIRPQDENKFQNLKVLNLSNCGYRSKSPNFSWFPCLERLDLGYCRSLDKLDESLGQLSKLKSLILESCDSLEELPESICDLKSLVELQLSNVAKIKELPDGVGLLENLEVLDVSHFYLLVRLPDLSRLKILRRLSVDSCEKLEEIQGLEGVRSFEDLDATQCCNLTNTPRKIHGQGRLSPECTQELIYSLNANDGICKKGLSLVLCIVFEFPPDLKHNLKFKQHQPQTIYFDILASIRRNDKTARCRHTLRIEDVEYTTRTNIIYIHHLKGFNWFGIPLEGKDAIEILYIRQSKYLDDLIPNSRVKFWKLLFQKPDQKKPNVADFFNWSDVEASPSGNTGRSGRGDTEA
ncbi:disease resistance protein RUN1-like isoform X2 [Macadamia integrifolia]|uniref:disease resistance protein RUN1-like isoform X2 n=1 Tax=Macadamia integrifolia TaxID=60698 RepID=UPI001C52EB9C|nr:disease resistance protein RUN1-like isoform X2 [Macadamia integrifolia]